MILNKVIQSYEKCLWWSTYTCDDVLQVLAWARDKLKDLQRTIEHFFLSNLRFLRSIRR